MRVHPAPLGPAAHAERSTVLGDLQAGWQEVRTRPWLWVTIAVFTGAVLCMFAQWYALAPSVSRDLYGSAAIFGLLEGVAGGGALVGSLAGVRWRPAHPLRTGLLLVFAWPAQAIAFAGAAPVWTIVVLAFAIGFGFSLFGVWWKTALANNVPAHLLSRVSAWDWMGSLALLPVGYLIAAPLAAALGARTVLGAGGMIGFALLAVALVPRSTRRLRGGAPSPAERPGVLVGDPR